MTKNKLTANVILNSETLKLSFKIRNKTRMFIIIICIQYYIGSFSLNQLDIHTDK